MRFQKPTTLIWAIASILAVAGLLVYLVDVQYFAVAFWLEFAGLALLLVTTGFKSL